MSNRCLLIGGNGFIGSNLKGALLNEGYKIRILDPLPEKINKPCNDIEYILGDYTESSVLRKSLEGCDIVIHLAHGAPPIESLQSPDQEVLNNITGFVRMLEMLKGGVIKRFLYFSSGGTVYGNPARLPVNEEFHGYPVSPYGVSKLCMEQYLHLFSYLNDLPYQIVRPSNPFGPYQNYKGIQGIIPISLYKAMTGKKIEIWGDGTAKKDYIFIDDLNAAVIKMLKSEHTNETFNVGSGIGLSINELLSEISILMQHKLTIEYVPGKKQDVKTVVLDVSKARTLLGWDCKTSMKKGLKITQKWLQEELNKSGELKI